MKSDTTEPMPPCRLSVLLAREAPVGVVLRRGPSQWVQVIRWDTEKDVFDSGQWFHGRIYADRCDLSPNGRLFLYFALPNGRSQEGYGSTWTAISRPPYLTALALWPHESTWGGGGLFLTDETVCLRHQDLMQHPSHVPRGLQVQPCGGGHMPYAVDRLLANGWGVEKSDRGRALVRESCDRKQVLRLPQRGLSVEAPSYVLKSRQTGTETALEGATWADWDLSGRLVYAAQGRLYSGRTDAEAHLVTSEIADFNPHRFEPIKSPGWALRW